MGNKGEVYLHVGNSGASVIVLDDGHGPTLKVATGAFGNLKTEVVVSTTKKGLELVGLMLYEASRENYSEPYCHAAEPPDRRRRSGRGEQMAVSGTQWQSGKGKTTLAEVLDLLREKARAAGDFYEEKINGRTRRLKAIDSDSGRLIIDIDDSTWVHDGEWIESVDHISLKQSDESLPPRSCVETALAILKARFLFASEKQGGARLTRNELGGTQGLGWRDIEELVALGLLYVDNGRLMFREEAPLSAVVNETYVNAPVTHASKTFFDDAQALQATHDRVSKDLRRKPTKLVITCDHKGGDEYHCELCGPAAKAAEAATINANAERVYDPATEKWVPKP